MSEVICDAAEYSDPNDLDSMRCAISNLAYLKSRFAELRKFGEARLTYFSWEKCMQKTFDVYQAL